MTNMFRFLMSAVVDGDMKKAQTYAQNIAANNKIAKDKVFCDSLLKKLEAKKKKIEVPYNLQSVLELEEPGLYKEDRFLLRNEDMIIANKILKLNKARVQLREKGIRFVPSLLLYGPSGCGKTELARWIAHKLGYPFTYVRFSSLMSSLLGETQKNISKIFDFVRDQKIVLCFDEIDAIGVRRGSGQDVNELSRITISLMQELDRLNGDAIIIGTTNWENGMDPALIRRFQLKYNVLPFQIDEAKQLAWRYMDCAGILASDWTESDFENWFSGLGYAETVPASQVVTDCTEQIAAWIVDNIDTAIEDNTDFETTDEILIEGTRCTMIDGNAMMGLPRA